MSRRTLYWISQFGGWSIYAFFAGIVNRLSGNAFNTELVVTLLSVIVTGIITTHAYRVLINRMGWKNVGIARLIPRVLTSVVVFAAVFHVLQTALTFTAIGNNPLDLGWGVHFQRTLNWGILLFIWSLIYFVFHFFEDFRKQEIKTLRLEANRIETELNKLKSQLNPHFMFNSMNTIKALVDEDPKKAKKSITQLSNILRNTLMMGKNQEIPFAQELSVVQDYLELESTRYEERLKVTYKIDPESRQFSVPPLMIQTLVENGIKHGVSKLTKGGELELTTKVADNKLHVSIRNSGQLQKQINGTGFGIENTRQRLQLLYDQAGSFHIQNENAGTVLAEVVIPKKSN